MEKKVEGKGVKRWLNNLLGRSEPRVSSPTSERPRVVALSDHVLESFTYDGYDIEARIYPDRSLELYVFLKGQCCLEGDYSADRVWSWSLHATNAYVPGYGVRSYLKQYALQRANKE